MPELRSNDLLPDDLVVSIGASAGGLAAFKTFLANTPADTGMAFIPVQHLDPQHKSLLVELPGAPSPIPVMAAEDNVAVRKNCVIPPNATLTINDGILRLVTPAPSREQRRPIDTFFVALAEDCGDRAVAIVLSGVGALETLVKICESGENETARVAAANALLDRGYGKPSQHVDLAVSRYDSMSERVARSHRGKISGPPASRRGQWEWWQYRALNAAGGMANRRKISVRGRRS